MARWSPKSIGDYTGCWGSYEGIPGMDAEVWNLVYLFDINITALSDESEDCGLVNVELVNNIVRDIDDEQYAIDGKTLRTLASALTAADFLKKIEPIAEKIKFITDHGFCHVWDIAEIRAKNVKVLSRSGNMVTLNFGKK